MASALAPHSRAIPELLCLRNPIQLTLESRQLLTAGAGLLQKALSPSPNMLRIRILGTVPRVEERKLGEESNWKHEPPFAPPPHTAGLLCKEGFKGSSRPQQLLTTPRSSPTCCWAKC